MSQTIFCVREPADDLRARFRCYKNVCEALLRRTKGPLYTKNPYLFQHTSDVRSQLEFARITLEKFTLPEATGILTRDVGVILEALNTKTVEAIRHLEFLIKPLEDDWAVIFNDASDRLLAVRDELRMASVDVYLVSEVIKLGDYYRDQKCVSKPIETAVRNQLLRKRALLAKLRASGYRQHQTTVQQPYPVFTDDSPATVPPASAKTPSEEHNEVSDRSNPFNDPESGVEASEIDRDLGGFDFLAIRHLELLYIERTIQNEDINSPPPTLNSPGRTRLLGACKKLIDVFTEQQDVLKAMVGENEVPEEQGPMEEKTSLDGMVDSMDPEISDRTIATLVLHWTTVNDFNGFKRRVLSAERGSEADFDQAEAQKTSRKHSKILRRVMIKGTLSVNATATLKRGERQVLEAFKTLGITIKPYRREWNTLPRDTHNMIEAVAFELERRCIDSWLIIEVSKLAEGACVEYAPIRDKLLQRECVMTAIQGVAGVRESEIEFTRTQIGHHATDEWLLDVDAAEDRWPDEGNPDHDLQTSSEREALSITSDYLIDMMNTPVSDRDIAMLVFHWTTLSRCNKYERLQSSRKPWQDVRKKDCGDRETS
ncbi:hypothetical protein E4T42_00786 [Aureobasidium subglaciale]|nr:hypothetical protein E4T42_00786 [Aureobasidium subglaciale]